MATNHLRTQSQSDRSPIDLAREQPFKLGDLSVAPALRELAAPDGSRQTLEPRVMQVLVALWRAEGAIVSRDELIRTCWNGTVVGEGAINRAISLLRRVSERIGGEAFRVETISKVGYRLLPDETEPQHAGADLSHNQCARDSIRSHPYAWVGAALLVVLGVAAALLLRPVPEGPVYSVHVAPFRVYGDAATFNDELLSSLTSQNVPLSAGRNLLALSGSVEELDGTIRVNARLTAPDRQEVVWSGAIDRAPTEPSGSAPVAAVASIIGSIAQCTLAGANNGDGSVPLDLLSDYARTCELGHRGQSRQGIWVARELTRRAPDFAPAWFALSFHARVVYLTQSSHDPELRTEALAAAEKLIELRPSAQDGYASKFAAMEPIPTAEKERLLLRAARLEPLYADVAQGYLGRFLWQAGRLEEAFQLRMQLAEQRPDDPFAHYELFYAAAATDRWPIADQAIKRVRQLNPALLPSLLWRKAVLLEDWEKALQWAPVEYTAQDEAVTAAYRALASGSTADKELAARLIRALPADCCVRLRVELLSQLGNQSEALAILDLHEAQLAREPRQGLHFLWDPALRALWYDSKSTQFLRRSGLLDYWNEAEVKPDLCRGASPPPFCRLVTS